MVLTLWIALPAATARADVIPRLKNGENLKIAAIGTSLTDTPGSWWFDKMGAWLNEEYPGQVTLYNEAVSASASKYTATYTSPDSGLDAQLGRALLHGPDAIFIEFAVNDAYTPYGISQQMSRNNLQAMIDQISDYAANARKNVDVVIQTMNNCADINGHDAATKRPALASYYQGYRDVAAANHLLLIDHYPNWVDLYNSQPDHTTWLSYMDVYGCHPNETGTQDIIMPELKKALLSQVPEPSSLVLLYCGLIILGKAGYRSKMFRRKGNLNTRSM